MTFTEFVSACSDAKEVFNQKSILHL